MVRLFQQLDDQEWTLPGDQRLTAALPAIDPLRYALDTLAHDPDQASLHIALATASAWVWQPAGLHREGLAHLERAGARIDDDHTPRRTQARWHTMRVLAAMPLPGAGERVHAERAVALYRELGDPRGLYNALGASVRLLAVAREFHPAEAALAELEALHDPEWPPASRTVLLTARGYLAYFTGQVEEALTAYEALLKLVTKSGDPWAQRSALIFLEQAMQALGRFKEAVRLGRELIAQQRALPFRSSLTMPWANLCQALTEIGELDDALQAGCEALNEGLHDDQLWLTLDVFAYLAGKRGRLGDAALAFGCADAEFARRGAVRQPNEQRAHDVTLAALREAMPAYFVSALLTEGAALSVEEAARLALDA